MKEQKILLATLCLIIMCSIQSFSQEITQTIRGTVIDIDSKSPIIGATISVYEKGNILGTTSDINGDFRMDDLSLGRHQLEISYLGYKTLTMTGIMLDSGKELVLDIELEESIIQLETVEISATSAMDKSKPLNNFATVSSRTFSVEETSRYAAASFDPARMALNFAGVSTGASDDLFNEIIIRGNTPGGVLWRLEGIEIPNPNHFADVGNSGGAISMLSSSTLTNSDFYTGAFPSEFGNATSGVFDLKMRNGNNEKRESSFMFGALGVELSTEGPLSRASKSSYLVNYRYSTLALLQASGINPAGEILPTYQDLSFKLNFPTKKMGTFSIFGLGGNNLAADNPAEDPAEWEFDSDRRGFEENGTMGVVGLSHTVLLSPNSYLKTVAINSVEKQNEISFRLRDDFSKENTYSDEIKQLNHRVSMMYSKKVNAKNSMRLGAIYSHKKFNFKMDFIDSLGSPLLNRFNNTSATGLVQAYGQWKYKPSNKITINTGVHYSILTFNNAFAVEPRSAISYKINNKQELTFATGFHSRMENIAVYSFSGKFNDQEIVREKKNLGISKSFHNVLAYDIVFSDKLRLKAEAYYQYLFNIPIREDVSETFSMLNVKDVWDVIEEEYLVPEGTGTNIGLDLTLERFLNNGYYFLVTGSLYDSKYKTLSSEQYNTRFNGNYQISTLAGKEWKVGKNIFSLNGKFVNSGGGRIIPVDLAASIAQDDEVLLEDQGYSMRTGNYYRLDVGINYKINTKSATHTIMFDVQNVTNRENPAETFYNEETKALETEDLTGLFPFINYRIEF